MAYQENALNTSSLRGGQISTRSPQFYSSQNYDELARLGLASNPHGGADRQSSASGLWHINQQGHLQVRSSSTHQTLPTGPDSTTRQNLAGGFTRQQHVGAAISTSQVPQYVNGAPTSSNRVVASHSIHQHAPAQIISNTQIQQPTMSQPHNGFALSGPSSSFTVHEDATIVSPSRHSQAQGRVSLGSPGNANELLPRLARSQSSSLSTAVSQDSPIMQQSSLSASSPRRAQVRSDSATTDRSQGVQRLTNLGPQKEGTYLPR